MHSVFSVSIAAASLVVVWCTQLGIMFMSPEEASEERYGVGIYFGQDIDGQV